MMRTTLISLACVIFTAQISAQKEVRRVQLNECIAIAIANSPAIQAAEKKIEQHHALEGTAWDINRTELSLSQDPTSGGSPDNALSIQQSIEFPTVYIARHRQLRAETQAQYSWRKVEEDRLKADVMSAYALLAYHTERIKLLEKNDSTLSRYTNVANKRYTAGETRQLELLQAQRMRRENCLELQTAKAELSNAQLVLKQLMNTDFSILPADETLNPLPLSDYDFDYAQTAEGEYDAFRIKALKRAITVAKSGYAPSLSVQLNRQMVISSWNPYGQDRSRFSGGNFMGFEIGIGIPLFYGATKARVRAAKREHEAAEIQLTQKKQEKKRDYEEALRRCHEAKQRIDFYGNTEAEQAEEMRRLAQLEYENGEIGYVEYSAAIQSVFDTKMKHIDAINDFNQNVVQLIRIGVNSITGE